ncbi:cytochrome P450 [Nocardia sp. 2]|uniref:Cytochrome P450 n=1 Tax=Nocardia acididurans TaxID=2802282 RepID=A0ABS1M6E5_9NOCA|nr:cytochrome P450 [Nocardia acididurans]
MSARYRFRWLFEHGAPRLLLRTQAWRGDPFGKLTGSADGLRDPYPFIEEIRRRGPLVPNPIGFSTADYEVIRTILRDDRWGVFTIDGVRMPQAAHQLIRDAPIPPNPAEAPSMLLTDPPVHTRLRRSVQSAFTPYAIARLRTRVEAVTTELLEALPANGTADLIHGYAAQLPVAIISEMLGFPDESRAEFLEWGDRITALLDIGVSWKQWSAAVESQMGMDGYLDRHIAELRRAPGEDILSSLVTAGDLDDHELKGTASLLMGAGFETTVNLIGNGVHQLLAHPEQLALVRANPALWPQAVEEILRFDSPVRITARMALSDTEIAGRALPAGTVVVMSVSGANRDPKVFDDPNTFDVNRANAKDHLGFSNGIHVCLGAALARMEGAYALRSLFDTFPDLSIEGPAEYRQLVNLYGFSRLPVRLGQRANARV